MQKNVVRIQRNGCSELALAADPDGGLILAAKDDNDRSQQWNLVLNQAQLRTSQPNLTRYTLYNVYAQRAAKQPPKGDQVRLGEDQPDSESAYAWSIQNITKDNSRVYFRDWNGEGLIQTPDSNCAVGTEVVTNRRVSPSSNRDTSVQEWFINDLLTPARPRQTQAWVRYTPAVTSGTPALANIEFLASNASDAAETAFTEVETDDVHFTLLQHPATSGWTFHAITFRGERDGTRTQVARTITVGEKRKDASANFGGDPTAPVVREINVQRKGISFIVKGSNASNGAISFQTTIERDGILLTSRDPEIPIMKNPT